MTSEAQAIAPDIRTDPAVEEEARIYVASQWKLTWWRFRKHKVALGSGIVVIFIYLVALFAEFLAPFPTTMYNATYTFAPPQRVHLFLRTEEGLRYLPHVNGFDVEIDPVALRRTFTIDPDVIYEIGFFVEGFSYRMLGVIETNIHLIGPIDPDAPMYLLGADRLGRDVFSRLIFGTRISMSIGLIGVFLSFILGILLGGISGLYGGMADNLIQRLIEFLRSIPTIPLWLGLAAAMPITWSPLYIYFGITIILSLIGWTDLARVVRGHASRFDLGGVDAMDVIAGAAFLQKAGRADPTRIVVT
ncbi:MAG: hypothetical protein R6W76_01420, partial [Caldilinea sp.]